MVELPDNKIGKKTEILFSQKGCAILKKKKKKKKKKTCRLQDFFIDGYSISYCINEINCYIQEQLKQPKNH